MPNKKIEVILVPLKETKRTRVFQPMGEESDPLMSSLYLSKGQVPMDQWGGTPNIKVTIEFMGVSE
jgi:hypothetical protein